MEEKKCSVCGTVVNPGDTFCQNCGSPVDSAPAQQDTTVLSGNPFSISNDETPASNPAGSTGSQAAGTYQQPSSGMDTNAQGTYGTYNTTYNVNNYTQAAPVQQSKGLGIAGLILSILGLLTSCCYGGFLFGLIGLILSIVYLVKKGSKGLGISGAVIGGIGIVASLIWLVIGLSTGQSIMDELQSFNDPNIGNSTSSERENPFDTTEDDNGGISTSNVAETNQILVNGTDLYTMPASLSELGLTVNEELNEDELAEIQEGLYAGDYKFVVLDSDKGYSFWGFVENTGSDTVYSVDDLQVTGINVDNYSSACTAYSAEVYGGITLNMSRSDVEVLIGTEDDNEDGLSVYYSESGNEILRLEYDSSDYVCAIDITIY